MKRTTIRVFILNALSLVMQIEFGSSVMIDVTTQYHDGVIPNAFNIRCTPQTQGNCAMSIISIQVIKDGGKNIATIQGQNSISYNRLMQSSLKAEGNIDRDISKSFLTVTVNDAVKEDSGFYTCKLLYFDESLQFKSLTASSNVTISNQDTQDIIKHLLSKISFLENLVRFQGDELSNVKTGLVDQGTQFQSHQSVVQNELAVVKTTLQTHVREANETNLGIVEKVTDLERTLVAQKTDIQSKLDEQKTDFMARETQVHKQIDVLKMEITSQEQDLRLLNQTESFTTAFSVEQPTKAVFTGGNTILFTRVILNVGGHYDMDTGVYTAPRNGLYVFHLLMTTTIPRHSTDFDLKVNDKIVASMHTYDAKSWESGSISTVTSLNPGDQVKPVARTGTHLKVAEQYTVFNGYLLKLT